jgi:predicted DNA-binding transcriptional regulator YafY
MTMLRVLQHRGRMTANQLSAELEVSVRTVLRDVQALSEAGIPIYTVQGAGGGIALLDGFEARLGGITRDEAAGVLLAGQPALADALGLGAAARSTRTTLLGALPVDVRSHATALDGWFFHDPLGRAAPVELRDAIRQLARAIQASIEIELCTGDDPPQTVRPLGLVLEGGSWRLVHLAADATPQIRSLGRGIRAGASGRRFSRPADFDLHAFWN